mgnify:CR=1 FL=1
MNTINRVLIANRGEIAVRIIRACKELGISTVSAVSDIDKESLPAKIADNSVCIGPSKPEESYLKVEAIIAAALGTDSDSIHPGYGFLSENPLLPDACEKYGINFIGPSKTSILQMGDKAIAKKLARDIGAPLVPGAQILQDYTEAIKEARTVGYPVMLKATAGGGGRGMAVVSDDNEMKTIFEIASTEAKFAFGDGRLFLEQFIPNARHIEVQILADKFGNIIHLGNRDCSLQRRHQKILEEGPTESISSKFRDEMYQIAINITRQIQYHGAGTIEFIVDLDRDRFYFLEMNTRIQVEHPVTEMITGIDLVKEQIHIANNQHLGYSQSDIKITGYSIECRINAESLSNNFQPSPGEIIIWDPPEGDSIRIDTHCYKGYYVPPYYDSLIAKVITKGSDRYEAITNMQTALGKFSIGGINTNLPFHQFILQHPDFLQNSVNTSWVETILSKGVPV